MEGKYWVIGGQYADTSFDDMLDGTGRIAGPFASLAARMVVTGMVIVWIAVWVALVISSAITQRLNAQTAKLEHQALHERGLARRRRLERHHPGGILEDAQRHRLSRRLGSDENAQVRVLEQKVDGLRYSTRRGFPGATKGQLKIVRVDELPPKHGEVKGLDLVAQNPRHEDVDAIVIDDLALQPLVAHCLVMSIVFHKLRAFCLFQRFGIPSQERDDCRAFAHAPSLGVYLKKLTSSSGTRATWGRVQAILSEVPLHIGQQTGSALSVKNTLLHDMQSHRSTPVLMSLAVWPLPSPTMATSGILLSRLGLCFLLIALRSNPPVSSSPPQGLF